MQIYFQFLFYITDGRLLLVIDETGLESMLHVSKPLHQAAIMSAIEGLRGTGMKLPSTLWEYKVLNFFYALYIYIVYIAFIDDLVIVPLICTHNRDMTYYR